MRHGPQGQHGHLGWRQGCWMKAQRRAQQQDYHVQARRQRTAIIMDIMAYVHHAHHALMFIMLIMLIMFIMLIMLIMLIVLILLIMLIMLIRSRGRSDAMKCRDIQGSETTHPPPSGGAGQAAPQWNVITAGFGWGQGETRKDKWQG